MASHSRSMSDSSPFNSNREFPHGGHYHAIDSLDESGLSTSSLPYSIRVLLEGSLRNYDGFLKSGRIRGRSKRY